MIDVERLLTILRAGSYLDVACRAVGISVDGLDELMRDDDELRERVDRARADAEVASIVLISTAARAGNWLAAAWLLERQYPERYARASQRDGEKSQQTIVGSDRLDDLAERRAARRGGGA